MRRGIDVNEILVYLLIRRVIELYKVRDNYLILLFFALLDFHDDTTARNATSYSSVSYARTWTPL